MFQANAVFPGVTHIMDNMGVCFTLLEGRDRAFLIDAGYGLENVARYVNTLTDKPVVPVLTHGHHDHVLGCRWFDKAYLDTMDLDEFALRTGTEQREKVIGQAKEKGLSVPEDFLTAAIPRTACVPYNGTVESFRSWRTGDGDPESIVINVPGHTAGSLVVYVPERRLLLTGDDWNPCTWMWFTCSLPVSQWHENMRLLLKGLEREGGVEKIICSHQPMIREGTELEAYLDWITPETLGNADRTDADPDRDIRRITDLHRGWELMFDAGKDRDAMISGR